MKIFKPISIALVIIAMTLGLAACQKAGSSSVDKAQVESIVHDYLLDNPDILIQMSQKLQQKQQQQQQTQAVGTIKANAAAFFDGKHAAVAGNPNGKVTLVEFFDYQCAYCAHVYPIVKKIIDENPDVRIVFREFPIFGDVSEYASLAALYANTQGKYMQMHNALFDSGLIEGKMTTKAVDDIAKAQGLNVTAMKAYIKEGQAAFKAKRADSALTASYELARQIRIQGTPAFIVAPTPNVGDSSAKITFIPGAADAKKLQDAIDAAK